MKNNMKITPKRAHESERIVDALVSGYRTSQSGPQLNYYNVIEQLINDAQLELRNNDKNLVPKTLHLCILPSLIDGDYRVGWYSTEDVMYAPSWLEVIGEVDVITCAAIVDGQETYAYTVDADDVHSLIMREVLHA